MKTQDIDDRMFDSVAELFSVLSTPIRLKIISAVCEGEKNVSELLSEIDTTQPNMSQHLALLYRSGVLSKRRVGTQIYYQLENQRVAALCKAVCSQVMLDFDPKPKAPLLVADKANPKALAKAAAKPKLAAKKGTAAKAKPSAGKPVVAALR